MDKNAQILALFLDAPLQSWGYQSRFDQRTSFSMPTRSGIIGMICAAMGIDRSEASALDDFKIIKMTVLAFDQHPRLVDFHTVGGGWDKKKNPLNMVKKPDRSGQTIVTRREYLQGSKFGVLLEGTGELLLKIKKALENPVWGIWLGRKSCVPASPVCQGFFDSPALATNHLSDLAGNTVTRRLEDAESFEDGNDTLNDVPMDFSIRLFSPRRIRTMEE